MTIDWTDEYKRLVRKFISEHGSPVALKLSRYSGGQDDDVSVYGWKDWDKQEHAKSYATSEAPCDWVVPEGAQLYERTYSQFHGTNVDDLMEVGVNVTGCHCKCGRYEDVTLRWTGSVTEMLHSILGIDNTQLGVTL